jgi:hypothetical protein
MQPTIKAPNDVILNSIRNFLSSIQLIFSTLNIPLNLSILAISIKKSNLREMPNLLTCGVSSLTLISSLITFISGICQNIKFNTRLNSILCSLQLVNNALILKLIIGIVFIGVIVNYILVTRKIQLKLRYWIIICSCILLPIIIPSIIYFSINSNSNNGVYPNCIQFKTLSKLENGLQSFNCIYLSLQTQCLTLIQSLTSYHKYKTLSSMIKDAHLNYRVNEYYELINKRRKVIWNTVGVAVVYNFSFLGGYINHIVSGVVNQDKLVILDYFNSVAGLLPVVCSSLGCIGENEEVKKVFKAQGNKAYTWAKNLVGRA